MTLFEHILPSRQRTASIPRIVFLCVPPIQILDLTGPYEVFDRVKRFRLAPGYRLRVVATGDLGTSCGLSLGPVTDYRRLRGPVDTLLVVGGEGVEESQYPPELVRWVRRLAPKLRRIASICTGAFLLADAGLLDGRTAATHWAFCETLAKRFARVRVDATPIYLKDGNVYTSAGVTAGIDLALALLEEDYGSAVALRVARDLVLYLRRSGNQAQFSTLLKLQSVEDRRLAELIDWMTRHVGEQLSVERLARQASMSPRHFARLFPEKTGYTPGKFVEALRVEAARNLLETSHLRVSEVAHSCGFGDSSSLRRIFRSRLGMSPDDYRKRFGQGV